MPSQEYSFGGGHGQPRARLHEYFPSPWGEGQGEGLVEHRRKPSSQPFPNGGGAETMKLSRSDRTRRMTSAVMTSLTALCTVAVVGVLAIILVYVAQRGVSSLNLHFLIETPKPVGEIGRAHV